MLSSDIHLECKFLIKELRNAKWINWSLDLLLQACFENRIEDIEYVAFTANQVNSDQQLKNNWRT